jgi:uncharacterized protein YukE
MAHMTTDAAVLSKEAANFERIADELKSIVARVEATAADLDDHWQGAAARLLNRRFSDSMRPRAHRSTS